ncbi:MAG TPA: SDR family oxidoreductase [Steroidobacteraceae bacterium]|nr:SDR family oxidoreductase [Steroidobacteraceae bacterium]
MSTVLVTGANKGIGLEFCRQLSSRGAKVIAACRHASEPLLGLPVEVVEGVEMTSDAACAQLVEALHGVRIDWLVLNAGTYDSTSLGKLDFDRMRYEYDVDALGPLRVTQAVLANLSAKAKIAIVSSRAGSIADNTSGGIYGYRMAKAALNMAGVSLAKDLAARGISVVMLHPGMVDTDVLRSALGTLGSRAEISDAIAPSVAVHDMIQRIDELTLETSGRFLHRNGQVLPW